MVDSPGPIAQLAEQQPFKLLVPSSSLGGLTLESVYKRSEYLRFLMSFRSEYFGCVDVDHETNMNEGGLILNEQNKSNYFGC